VYALNLFFDGNNVTPRISAEAPLATAGNLNPSIAPYGGPGFTLAIAPVLGANTLSYVDDSQTITLANFGLDNSNLDNLDLVQAFDAVPGQGPDNIGSFTLNVSSTSTPEPKPLYLSAVGLLVVGCVLGARLKRAAQT